MENYSTLNTHPTPFARSGIHEKVIEYLHDKPRGKVLDIPTGYGALAEKLFDLKFDVSCCDIDPSLFTFDKLNVDQGDLNKRLPYKDEVFDYVCFLEGIEHTENPYNAIREISRVLKPAGTLIMTTPNYLNIERRLKFLITGSFTKPISQKTFKETLGGVTHGMHLSPIGYTILKFILENAGFKIIKITSDKKKRKQIFLKPLSWAICLYTKLWAQKDREKYWISETNSKSILNGGNTLIFLCEKLTR